MIKIGILQKQSDWIEDMVDAFVISGIEANFQLVSACESQLKTFTTVSL